MKRWKGFEHGINLGGWLSQCDHTKERYDTFIHEEDIEKIRSFGLDHIRVPVDYDLVEDAKLPDGYDFDQAFSSLFTWCQKAFARIERLGGK